MQINRAFLYTLAIFALIAAWRSYAPTVKVPPPSLYRNINYTVTITNQTNNAIPALSLSLYRPIAESAYQKSTSIDASIPYSSEKLEDGSSQSIKFDDFLLPPLANKVVSVQASVALWNSPLPSAKPDLRMLSPSAYIEASNSEIKDLSEKLNKTAEYDTAKAIFSWISPNIKSESYNGSPKSALNTLHQLQGDCTDAAHLFIALARASKIPARLVAGFYLDRDKRLRASDFHNWAEFYSENTWRIADPNLGHFDTNYTNYLAFQYPDGATEAEYITSSTRAKSNSAQVRIAFE